MSKNFSEVFYEKGIYPSKLNEIKRIDLLLDALKCQEEIHKDNEKNK